MIVQYIYFIFYLFIHVLTKVIHDYQIYKNSKDEFLNNPGKNFNWMYDNLICL